MRSNLSTSPSVSFHVTTDSKELGIRTWMGRSPSFATFTFHLRRPSLILMGVFRQTTAPGSSSGVMYLVGTGNRSSDGIGRNEPYSAFVTEQEVRKEDSTNAQLNGFSRFPDSEQTGSCTVTRKVLGRFKAQSVRLYIVASN